MPGADGAHRVLASPAPPSWTAPAELAAFVDASSGAAPPICLNFGSMAVYERAAWAPALLDGLRSLVATGRHRVVAVGDHVPESVRGWPSTLWVRSVPHAYLFPKCGCVIHHGGSGTSAAAAAAGVPSVVVPFLGWSDQPRFAAWLARAAAGVAVTDPASLDAAGWAAAVERAATDASLKAGAAALGRQMASEGGGGAAGAAAAVAAIDAHFGAEKTEKAPRAARSSPPPPRRRRRRRSSRRSKRSSSPKAASSAPGCTASSASRRRCRCRRTRRATRG